MPNGIPSSASPAIDDAALDRLLTSGAISIPDLTTRRAEFRLYTAAATTSEGDTNPDTGNPRVHAIGSSTIRDLQGDTMAASAIQDMQKAPPGLAIFVNHAYQVPEDLVGRLYDYPTSQGKRDIVDLILDVEVLCNVNPRAKQLYAGIQAGVRQGVSIGCMITAAEWLDADGAMVPDEDVDFWDIITGALHLNILGVDPLEWSFVGIPANQRSWVQYAAQGLFRRALRDRDGATASRLAPLVRGWFPTDFQHDLLDLAGDDAALRKTVGEVAPRRNADRRQLLWLPAQATFGLKSADTKRVQELSRERVAELLAGEQTHMTTLVKHTHAPQQRNAPDTTPDTTLATEPDAAKGATGKSDWPLGERDAAWDNGEAHKRIVDWAGGADDADVAKLKSVHFWSPEGDDAKDVSKYKLLYCDIVGGSVKAMPRAIMACWGAHGVEAADIPADDKDAIKKKLSAYAARMREAFDDDTIMPPWDKEDENKEESGADAVDAEKTVNGTGGDITVKADGQHDPYSGSHTHSHPAYGDQGDDGNHEHTHNHDNDANHHHQHDKAAEVEHIGGAPMAAQEIADSPLAARVETASAAAPDTAVDVDPQRAAMLRMFGDMVAPHGFIVLDATQYSANQTLLDKIACSWSDDEQSQIRAAVAAIDAQSDALMMLCGVPDHDEDYAPGDGAGSGAASEPDNSDVAGPRYPVTESATAAASAPARRLLTRAGARNSAEDRERLQAIHDAVYALTDGLCCMSASQTPEGEGDNADGADTAGGNGGGQSATDLDEAQRLLGGGATMLSALPHLVASISALGEVATTLKQLSLPALDEQVKTLAAAVDAAKAEQDALTSEHERIAGEIARLRGTPLGRPTQAQTHAQSYLRSAATANVDAPIPVVTAASLTPEGQAADAASALATAKAYTTIQHVPGVGPCRLWPEGVGKDVRPTLSHLQRMALEMGFTAIQRMLPASSDGSAATTTITSPESLITAYTRGGVALIPIVLDGE